MEQPPEDWRRVRTAVLRDAIGIGVATGAYALSFGAISTTSGLSVVQTCALSLVMFSGASQYALVGVLDREAPRSRRPRQRCFSARATRCTG